MQQLLLGVHMSWRWIRSCFSRRQKQKLMHKSVFVINNHIFKYFVYLPDFFHKNTKNDLWRFCCCRHFLQENHKRIFFNLKEICESLVLLILHSRQYAEYSTSWDSQLNLEAKLVSIWACIGSRYWKHQYHKANRHTTWHTFHSLYRELNPVQIVLLLSFSFHEKRQELVLGMVYQFKYARGAGKKKIETQMSILSRILEALFKCQSEIGWGGNGNESSETNSQQMWLISDVNLEYLFKYSSFQIPFWIIFSFYKEEQDRWAKWWVGVFLCAFCKLCLVVLRGIVEGISVMKDSSGLGLALYSIILDKVLIWPVGCFHLQVSVLPECNVLTSLSAHLWIQMSLLFICLNNQLYLFKSRQPLMPLLYFLKGTFAHKPYVTMQVLTWAEKGIQYAVPIKTNFRLSREISRSRLANRRAICPRSLSEQRRALIRLTW